MMERPALRFGIVFIALKIIIPFNIYFTSLQPVLLSCGGYKMSPEWNGQLT